MKTVQPKTATDTPRIRIHRPASRQTLNPTDYHLPETQIERIRRLLTVLEGIQSSAVERNLFGDAWIDLGSASFDGIPARPTWAKNDDAEIYLEKIQSVINQSLEVAGDDIELVMKNAYQTIV